MTTTRRIALVTGSNKGIGFEVARQLAQKGFQVILSGRDATKLKQAHQSLVAEKLEVDSVVMDVASGSSVDQAIAKIIERHGKLDVLVNNAGVFLDEMGSATESILKVDLKTIQETLDINLFGALRVAQAVAPGMKKNKYGRIVNLSSGMGQLSEMNGFYPAYRISKTALNAVTRILSEELKADGVLVNSVCPGWVKTDMGGPNAERTVAQGADGVVWLATLPDNGPTGGFFRDRKKLEW